MFRTDAIDEQMDALLLCELEIKRLRAETKKFTRFCRQKRKLIAWLESLPDERLEADHRYFTSETPWKMKK